MKVTLFNADDLQVKRELTKFSRKGRLITSNKRVINELKSRGIENKNINSKFIAIFDI